MVEIIVISSVLLAMILTIIRAILGSTKYDRILAVNVFGTITVMLIVLLGYYFNYYEAFDIALVYALINFTTTIAFLKYTKYKSFR